jgi:hypothetical protein
MEEAMEFRRSDQPTKYRVFYPNRRGVLVTDAWFYAPTHRFAVPEIENVGWCQSTTQLTGRVVRLVVGTEAILVIPVAIGASASSGGSFVAFGLAGLYLALVALMSWFTAHRYPGALQLWAQRRGGGQMLLFSMADHTEFHKVRRAMERAIEYNRELAA